MDNRRISDTDFNNCEENILVDQKEFSTGEKKGVNDVILCFGFLASRAGCGRAGSGGSSGGGVANQLDPVFDWDCLAGRPSGQR